jgi:hypothetical protein
MADWFKFKNDCLSSKGMQFAMSEQPLVTSVFLVILSEASKARSSSFKWSDEDFEMIGFARLVNVSVPVFNQSIGLLERIKYISRKDGVITVNGWDDMQSDYAKGLNKGYYRKTSNKLASNSEVSTARGEERRGEEKRINKHIEPVACAPFEVFWSAYPKKVGKDAALKKFLAALEKTTLEKMLAALSAQSSSDQWTKDGGRYIPNPTTWLNQGRWNDVMAVQLVEKKQGWILDAK